MRGRGDRTATLRDDLEAIVFAEGIAALTVDALAQRLKCSKRTLYHLGAGKREMVASVIAQWSRRIEVAAAAATEVAAPADRLSAYLAPGVAESRQISRAFLRDVAADPVLGAALRAHQRGRVAGLAALLREGIAGGLYRDVNVELVAALCIGAIDRLDDPLTLEASGTDFGAAFETFYGLLMDGLRSPPRQVRSAPE